MKQRITITPEALRQRYIDEGQTLVVIAAAIGCSAATVSNMLRRYGIPARPGRFPKRINIPREVLVQLYCVEHVLIKDIAKQLGVSINTINNLRKAYDIPQRRPRNLLPPPTGGTDATSTYGSETEIEPPTAGHRISEHRQQYKTPHPCPKYRTRNTNATTASVSRPTRTLKNSLHFYRLRLSFAS
ncbi:hypothetical protein EKD04_005305 [Chloroflexales bacterium ZM16-3]|nr:hypothetical protein [Chloroflexales bacterium ZM16-3]